MVDFESIQISSSPSTVGLMDFAENHSLAAFAVL
jgi:hypothetical protein